jgi:predicted nucleotidyltransferase
MLTRKALDIYMQHLIAVLQQANFSIDKIILFGSYAKGHPNHNSDVDVAVWSAQFSGIRILDIEQLAPIISQFHSLELHPFSITDTALNNAFVAEIISTGINYKQVITP